MKQNKYVLWITQAAMIAAIYVVLTFVFAPISCWQVQVRIAEALTILPVFTPAAVPGLFVGCLIGNISAGAVLPDIIFGSLATLTGGILTRLVRHKNKFFAPLPPIVVNTLVVPFVLRYAYQISLPIPLLMLSIAIGECVSCGVLGMVLYMVLQKHGRKLFP